MNIIDVTAENVEQTGFFCKMSQRKSAGYRCKLDWLRARFHEGLTIKILDLSEGGRGFIEYVPGEYAWRPVSAAGYLFIHCLWVVGKSKGKGYAGLLLDRCIADARSSGLDGVAMVTSEGNWLMGKQLLVNHGFTLVDHAPPSFALLVKRFGQATVPKFPSDWDDRAARFGKGLTVLRTDQCPYLDDGVATALDGARERGIRTDVIVLQSAQEVRERAPTPYGVFCLLLDGIVISYHYLLRKDVDKRLPDIRGTH